MARIADKHGLTNKYRPMGTGKRVVRRGRPRKYLFGAPKRRSSRKTTSYRTNTKAVANNNYQGTSSNGINPVVGGLAVLLLIIVFIVIIANAGKDTTENQHSNNNSELNASVPNESQVIDITAYEGNSGVTASIDLEKEYDSHLMETISVVKNNSGKDIAEVTLYLVHCYGDDTPLESWEYADRLTIKDLPNGGSKSTEWLLGTTTYGKKTFVGYVGYVLYADGTEWGISKIDHQKVVTRDESISVTFREVEKFSWKK